MNYFFCIFSVIFMSPVATLAETATYAIHILSCQNSYINLSKMYFCQTTEIIPPAPIISSITKDFFIFMSRTTTNNNCRVLLVVNERLARRQWMTLLLMMTLIIGTRNYYVGSGTPVGNYAISCIATIACTAHNHYKWTEFLFQSVMLCLLVIKCSDSGSGWQVL